MTLEWTEETLCRAARQMTQGLAAALPEEDVPSPTPAERLRRVTRRARWRRLGQRAAMIALTAVLAFGAVLAVSPQARAAVGRWLFLLTENRALYQFFVEAEGSRAQPERLPRWLPEGYTLASGLVGADGSAGGRAAGGTVAGENRHTRHDRPLLPFPGEHGAVRAGGVSAGVLRGWSTSIQRGAAGAFHGAGVDRRGLWGGVPAHRRAGGGHFGADRGEYV